MITDTDAFERQRDAIRNLLLDADNHPRTVYVFETHGSAPLPEADLKEWYSVNFGRFPLYTSPASDEVTIPGSFAHHYHQYHRLDKIIEAEGPRIRETSGEERDGLLVNLDEYISEWIHNVFYDFEVFVTETKRSPVFACVRDELLIFRNLLKFYTEVRANRKIQLNFFHRLKLPQAVADEMADILILLLRDRIGMLSPEAIDTTMAGTTHKPTDPDKIRWLGQQQELAELIHSLDEKGYIGLPDMSVAALARFLNDIFDLSATKRRPSSDTAGNLATYLKPVRAEKTGGQTYSYVSKRYKPKFSGISPNPQKGK